METKYFDSGNYIYECKCSPSKIDGYFDTSYLKSAIKKLKALWISGNLPSGYRYVFPINYIDDRAKSEIANLQEEYPSVDIRYYECNDIQKLIISLKKVNDLPSLVDYLETMGEG